MVRVQSYNRLMLTGFSLFFGFKVDAFFENIIVWRSPSGQLVYGVSDDHGGMDEISWMRNEAQSYKLLEIFDAIEKKHQQNDFFAIVEDPLGYKGTHPAILNALYEYRNFKVCPLYCGTPLIDICRQLEATKIPFANVEYRFLREEAASQIGFGSSSSAESLSNSWPPVSGHEVVQEYEQAIPEVERYTDAIAQDYYQDILRSLKETKAAPFFALKEDHENFVSYVNRQIPEEHRNFFLTSMMYFDARLIDARVVHQIVVNSAVKKILIFCGGAHIYNIGIVLERLLHYTKVAHLGDLKEYPYKKITFDPSQDYLKDYKSYTTCLATTDQLELIGADEPERFSSGSYS